MPELPEIETIKRVIEPQIQGFAIEQVTVNRPEVIAHPAADEFCRRLTGQVFAGIGRRGKFLILRLESGDRLILHLRMTGCLLVTPADYPEEKHTHLVFHLICPAAGSCVFPTHAGLGDSGCCGKERQIHTPGWKSWAQNPLIPVSPGNTCLHAWENGRKPSRNVCWIRA